MPVIQRGGEFQVSNLPELDAQKQAQLAQLLLALSLARRAPQSSSTVDARQFLVNTPFGAPFGEGEARLPSSLTGKDDMKRLALATQTLVKPLIQSIGKLTARFSPLGIPSDLLTETLNRSPLFGGPLSETDLATLTGTAPPIPGTSALFGGPLSEQDLSTLTGTNPISLFEGIRPELLTEAGSSGAALAAEFGAQGAGEFGLNLPGGSGNFGSILPGLGVLANVGSGIFNLTQGNIPSGAGTLGGTALGAAIGSFIPGIGTLLGASIGGGAGGLLGGLFGGGHTQGSDIPVPAFGAGGGGTITTRTQGGTNTVLKSLAQGQQAAGAFQGRFGGVTDLPGLAALLGTRLAPFGELQVGSGPKGPTEGATNMPDFGWAGDWDDPASPEWTAALKRLQDPNIAQTDPQFIMDFGSNLWVQGPGATGVVPFNPALTQALQQRFFELAGLLG